MLKTNLHKHYTDANARNNKGERILVHDINEPLGYNFDKNCNIIKTKKGRQSSLLGSFVKHDHIKTRNE